MTTRHLRLVTLTHSVTIRSKSSVLSPFGPVSQGLTTSPRTEQDLVLSELLSSLERKIDELNTKSCTVYAIFKSVTKEIFAEPLPSTLDTVGTDSKV